MSIKPFNRKWEVAAQQSLTDMQWLYKRWHGTFVNMNDVIEDRGCTSFGCWWCIEMVIQWSEWLQEWFQTIVRVTCWMCKSMSMTCRMCEAMFNVRELTCEHQMWVSECIQVNTESLGMQGANGIVTWLDNIWSCMHENTQTQAKCMWMCAWIPWFWVWIESVNVNVNVNENAIECESGGFSWFAPMTQFANTCCEYTDI